jgi:hypothetical protein
MDCVLCQYIYVNAALSLFLMVLVRGKNLIQKVQKEILVFYLNLHVPLVTRTGVNSKLPPIKLNRNSFNNWFSIYFKNCSLSLDDFFLFHGFKGLSHEIKFKYFDKNV